MSLGVVGLSQIGAFVGWETRAIDTFLFLRDREPSPQIALVLIDDEAFREMGERQPLSRRYLAELADFLLGSGARVVALDILLQTSGEADEDRMLLAVAERCGRTGRLVFGQEVVQQETPAGLRYEIRPHFSPALQGASGFINTPIDADGLARRMHPVLPAVRGGLLPSLPLAALTGWAGIEPVALARTLAAGSEARLLLPVADRAGGIRGVEPVRIGLLERARWRISFADPPGTFTSFPAGPLIAMARAGVKAAADNPFRDRIVFVGGSFAASRAATGGGSLRGGTVPRHPR